LLSPRLWLFDRDFNIDPKRSRRFPPSKLPARGNSLLCAALAPMSSSGDAGGRLIAPLPSVLPGRALSSCDPQIAVCAWRGRPSRCSADSSTPSGPEVCNSVREHHPGPSARYETSLRQSAQFV